MPLRVVADFEVAIHNAVTMVWKDVEITGCRFHLLQAWFRKVQTLGLSKDYRQGTEVGKWIQYSFGLPFLAPDEVTDCFLQDLFPVIPEDRKLTAYRDYLLDNYIADNSARFPSHMWAARSADMARTTNACESFHADFNSSFYHSHPDLYTFIDTLLLFQNKTYIKMNNLGSNVVLPVRKEVKQRREFIQQKIEEYEGGLMTRFQYVKCLSYFYKTVLCAKK
jgi:hypothetical protein